MYLVLTDVLTCPRCGPTQGLIVLSERMEERRIMDGALGCPNCQTQYPIRNGLADLRPEGEPAEWEGTTKAASDSIDSFKIAALLGITGGTGFALLLGATNQLASGVTEIVPQVELIIAGPGLEAMPEQRGVNRLRVATQIPLRDGSMRGVVILDEVEAPSLRRLVRLLGPGARLVTRGNLANTELEKAGLRVLARDTSAIVATRVA